MKKEKVWEMLCLWALGWIVALICMGRAPVGITSAHLRVVKAKEAAVIGTVLLKVPAWACVR